MLIGRFREFDLLHFLNGEIKTTWNSLRQVNIQDLTFKLADNY